MRPTSREIIESIVAAIDNTILPAVEEKQAASSLRAARTLLEHLAARVEIEPDVLLADNADAEATMLALGVDRLPPLEGGGVTALNERNEALQKIIDDMLRAMPIAGQETPEQATIRGQLRVYLGRRQAREREMIFPAFLGTPF